MCRTKLSYITLSVLAYCAAMTAPAYAQVPTGYDGYQVVQIDVTNEAELETVRRLEVLGHHFEVWSEVRKIGPIEVRVSPAAQRVLEASGLRYKVVVEDLQRYIDLRTNPWGGGFFDYLRGYDEHVQFMSDLAAQYPDLAEMISFGNSVEGRPMWALRITNAGEVRPGVNYHGAEHGNEQAGASVVAYVAYNLLTNYDTDPDIAYLVDHVEWFLLPIMNPDGYVRYSRYNAHGVDLNRNWDGPGAGQDPSGGPYPFSEPETANMRDFFLASPHVRTHVDLHGYVPWIMWPWAHIPDHTPEHATFYEMGNTMRDLVYQAGGGNYEIGTIYEVAYPTSGCSANYTYGVLGLWAFGIEVVHSTMPRICEEFLSSMLYLGDWIWDHDCNGNGVFDSEDILNGTSRDTNNNGIPDECEGILLLHISFPEGLPEFLTPRQPTDITVQIFEGEEEYIPGSGTLHYRYYGGDFETSLLEPLGGELYLATLPPAGCDATPEYYFSAEGTVSGVIYQPPNAPTDTFSANVGELIEVFADNFETDRGWTVENQNLETGAWERAIPSGSGGSRGDPPTDFDGSGHCYVTGNDYDEDVDGGPTRLTSPTLDLSAGDEHTISYARWIYNDDGDDTLDVEISNGGGWVLVESVTGLGGWVERPFSVADFVTPNATVRVRFTTADQPNDSVTEAGLDAFWVTAIECEEGDVILPDDYTIVRGQHVSGGLTDLFYSDDSYLLLWPNLFLTPTEPPVWVIVEGTATTASPAGLSFTLEAYATTTGLVQKIELFNYVTQSYEELDSRNTTLSDSVVEVVVTGDPSRFIEPGTLAMKAQLTWRFGPVGVYAFDVGIDQTVWTITP